MPLKRDNLGYKNTLKFDHHMMLNSPYKNQSQSVQEETSMVEKRICTSLSKLSSCDSDLMNLIQEIQVNAEKEFKNIQKIIDNLETQLGEKEDQLEAKEGAIENFRGKLHVVLGRVVKMLTKTGLYVQI